MKKFLVIILAIFFNLSAFAASYADKQLREIKNNIKYNTVQKQVQNIDTEKVFNTNIYTEELKDPQLIKLTEITPVDDVKYSEKIKADEKVYRSEIIPSLNKKVSAVNIEPMSIDFYKVYRVAERLIRANNLGYTNWRIAIRKTPENVNAYSTAANLVVLHTSLYDSLYANEDALAYVIAHEMAHLVLGHDQRTAELQKLLNKGERASKKKHYYTSPIAASVQLVINTGALAYKKHVFSEYRIMEFMADTEAFNMLIKAGYSPDNALYALKFLDSMPDVKHIFRDHPMIQERIANAKETIYFANPKWIEEGKYNIYNSNVLNCKKSSDHVSIIISKDDSIKNLYELENINQKLTRLAYVSYKKGDMKNASKYFEKLANLTEDYRAYLYLSYANSYLYKQTKNESYLKKSKEAAQKADKLNPNNEYIKEML